MIEGMRGSLPYLIKNPFWRGLFLGLFIGSTGLIICLAAMNEQNKIGIGSLLSFWFFQWALLPLARLHRPFVLFLELFSSGPTKYLSGYKTVDIGEIVVSYGLLIGGICLGCMFSWLTILEI